MGFFRSIHLLFLSPLIKQLMELVETANYDYDEADEAPESTMKMLMTVLRITITLKMRQSSRGEHTAAQKSARHTPVP